MPAAANVIFILMQERVAGRAHAKSKHIESLKTAMNNGAGSRDLKGLHQPGMMEPFIAEAADPERIRAMRKFIHHLS